MRLYMEKRLHVCTWPDMRYQTQPNCVSAPPPTHTLTHAPWISAPDILSSKYSNLSGYSVMWFGLKASQRVALPRQPHRAIAPLRDILLGPLMWT